MAFSQKNYSFLPLYFALASAGRQLISAAGERPAKIPANSRRTIMSSPLSSVGEINATTMDNPLLFSFPEKLISSCSPIGGSRAQTTAKVPREQHINWISPLLYFTWVVLLVGGRIYVYVAASITKLHMHTVRARGPSNGKHFCVDGTGTGTGISVAGAPAK